MSQKILIIGIVGILITISMIIAFSLQEQPSDKISVEESKVEGIRLEYSPSVYRGIVRENEKYAFNLSDDRYIGAEKIKILMDYMLDVQFPTVGREHPVFGGITIDDGKDSYWIVRTGPQLLKGEVALNDEELKRYRTWAYENLVSVPSYMDVHRHYIEYKGEIFDLRIRELTHEKIP